MVYYRALRDCTLYGTNHFVAEDSLITLKEYQRITHTTRKPSPHTFEVVEIPKCYVYFSMGFRYPYIGAEEYAKETHYNDRQN